MRLAETDAAPDEEWVVGFARCFGDGETRRIGKPVRFADDERAENIARIQSAPRIRLLLGSLGGPLGADLFVLPGFRTDAEFDSAGDAAFLRNATITAVVLGFLPPVWLTLSMDWGLTGVWWGLLTFMVLRLVFVAARYRGPKWTVAAGE